MYTKYTKRFLISITIIGFLVAACSGAPESTTADVPSPLPAMNTPLPTDTPTPTNTAAPTATATITPSPTPTFLFPTPQFAADLLEENVTVFGSNDPLARLYFFYGHEGDLVSLQVESKEQSPITLKEETIISLLTCERKSNTICVIEKYLLPYTGIYYILVDRLPSERHHHVLCRNKPQPIWCTKGGPFTLVLTIE